MTVTPVSGTGSTTPVTGTLGTSGSAAATSTSSTSQASGFDALGKDTFLKLMVAQLRNQDPMNPTDSTQFLAQTAQFTSLEKMTDIATQTSAALNAQMAFGASTLVGKQVTYTADDGSKASGPVSAVTFTSNGPVLTVGDADVPIASVVSVDAAAAPTSSSTAPTS